ncbi:hypothetical protein HY631_01000 [Candidatus Uhrbacteria bacterium]|nr:hypothetical protein [Candidatus Uhrbacteria bacterium]
MALEGLPSWIDEILRRRDHISPAGLGGLLGAYAVTMPLGEALARGLIDPAMLDAWVKTQLASKASVEDPLSVSVTEALLRRIAGDPRVFWSEFYAQKFGALEVVVPALPRISTKTRGWIDDGSLLPILLPAAITQDVYSNTWIRSDLGQHIDASLIKRHPLPGRWVVAELIRKPDWNDPEGYGDDRLTRELNLQSRFRVSWDHLRATLCPLTAQLWGLKKAAVRPLTAEEWNFFGNILLELNRLHGTEFPDLGATASWEWTESAYGSGSRVIVGGRGNGGLASVRRDWSDVPNGGVGFRLLGVL